MNEDFLLVINNIAAFNFNNMDVRIIDKENDPWFVLVDVCKILEIKNSSAASSSLDDDEKDYAFINTIRGSQKATIINKSGLYSLVNRSRKKGAKQFKKWIASEVFPSLKHKPVSRHQDVLNNSPTVQHSMNNNQNIIPFTFENTEVRVVNRDGEAWFVGSEVARALGYNDTDQAIRKHCKAAENCKPVDLTGLGIKALSPRGLVLIPERDVYRLVMRSKLPSAEQFEEKVVGEILPSIRKTGGYMVSIPNETPEQILSRALLLAKDTMDRKTQEIAELKPKADGYDRIASSDGSICITNAAKDLQIRPRELFDYLSINKWIIILNPV